MKEVIAIIRMNKMNETREALVKAGLPAFTLRKVVGRGKGKADVRILHGAEEGKEEAIAQLGQGPPLIPKRMINIVLPDNRVEEAVKAIITSNKTGNCGDGRIFICPVDDTVGIRTGESGDASFADK